MVTDIVIIGNYDGNAIVSSLLLLGIKLLNDHRALTGRMMTDNINDNN